MDSKLALYNKTRQYLRQRITRVHTSLHDGSLVTEDRARLLNAKLLNLQSEIREVDKLVFSVLVESESTDDHLNEHSDTQEIYEDKILTCLDIIKGVLARSDSSASGRNNDTTSYNSVNRIKLPEIPLPVFSNDKGEALEKFFFNFENIIEKHNLPSFEKYVFLKNQVRGAPRILIESLDIDNRNYEVAKDLLLKAFASKTNQKFNAIHMLSDLKLDHDTDPYAYIGDVRTVISTFNSLNIDVQTILNYFIWNGMNESFQNHLIQITNCNKPSLTDIENNLFEATERYNRQREKIREVKPKTVKLKSDSIVDKVNISSNNIALNVDTKITKPKFKICNLCKDDGVDCNHLMVHCQKYPSASEKVNKLKCMKAC